MRNVKLDIRKTKSVNYLRQLDYMLLFLVLALVIFGLITLSSAVRTFDDANSMLIKQIVITGVGVFCAFLLARFDYNDYKVLGLVLYCFSTFLLLLVLLIGDTILGSKSWLSLPLIGSFQPSEFAKLTFIMVCAVFLSRIKNSEGNDWLNLLKLLAYAAIPLGLVLLQRDYGTLIVYGVIFIVMLFAFGIKFRYLIIPFLASIPFAIFAWFFLLNDARKARILVFLDPLGVDPKGLGEAYQILRSLMTIGSGKISGKGLYHGVQTQKSFVPIKESDFIFTVVAEEFGFIGSVILIILFIAFLLRCIHIAKQSRDSYGAILVAGIVGMYGYHFIQNIGMCIGLMPITGLPLPFFSLGSSSMLTNLLAVGIVLSVSLRRKQQSIFEKT